MSAQVPPMFWFVFWVGLSVGMLAFGFFMAIVIHRANMKALEVLKSYAEKGIEPPPAVVEMLTKQMHGTDAERAGREVGRKAGNFTGLLAAACVAGGIAWALMNQGGPQFVVYFFAIAAVFFGLRAIAFLFGAFTTSGK